MSEMHDVLHGLAVKKHAGSMEIAALLGVDPDYVGGVLKKAETEQRIVKINNKYALTALGRIILDSDYSRHFSALRANKEFFAAYVDFEKINIQLKGLITDWQIMEVGGESVANDHSNKQHDLRIIDQLGSLHEKADLILAQLERHLSRMKVYREQLLSAIEHAEDGEIEWVSDVKIASYHTVWFELHEDLLRLLGQQRQE